MDSVLVKKTKTYAFYSMYFVHTILIFFFLSWKFLSLWDCSIFGEIPPTKENTLLTCSSPSAQFLNALPFIFYQNTFHDLNREISILFFNKTYGCLFGRWLFYFHFRKEIYEIELGRGNGFKAVLKFLGNWIHKNCNVMLHLCSSAGRKNTMSYHMLHYKHVRFLYFGWIEGYS